MSLAFRDSAVLWREPLRASARRVGGRVIVAAVWVALGGVPGGFVGFVPWTWLRVVLWIIELVAVSLAVLAVVNLIRTRGVLLVHRGTGSIERPRSIQERWLRRPVEWVDGAHTTVLADPPDIAPSRAAPFVTLTDGSRSLKRVPLHGSEPEEFVVQVNAALSGRGAAVTLGKVAN